jgi:hypothetical protein
MIFATYVSKRIFIRIVYILILRAFVTVAPYTLIIILRYFP